MAHTYKVGDRVRIRGSWAAVLKGDEGVVERYNEGIYAFVRCGDNGEWTDVRALEPLAPAPRAVPLDEPRCTATGCRKSGGHGGDHFIPDAPRAVEPPCAHSKAGSCTACMFEAQHREGYAVAEPVRKRKGAVAPAKWEDIPLDPPVGDWVSGKEHALVKAERDDLRVDLDRLIDGRWKPADLLQANADLRTHVARLERSLDLALKGRRR